MYQDTFITVGFFKLSHPSLCLSENLLIPSLVLCLKKTSRILVHVDYIETSKSEIVAHVHCLISLQNVMKSCFAYMPLQFCYVWSRPRFTFKDSH